MPNKTNIVALTLRLQDRSTAGRGVDGPCDVRVQLNGREDVTVVAGTVMWEDMLLKTEQQQEEARKQQAARQRELEKKQAAERDTIVCFCSQASSCWLCASSLGPNRVSNLTVSLMLQASEAQQCLDLKHTIMAGADKLTTRSHEALRSVLFAPENSELARRMQLSQGRNCTIEELMTPRRNLLDALRQVCCTGSGAKPACYL